MGRTEKQPDVSDDVIALLRQQISDGFDRIESQIKHAMRSISEHGERLSAAEERCRAHQAEMLRRDQRIDAISQRADRSEMSQAELTVRAQTAWKTITVVVSCVAGVAALLISLLRHGR